MVGGVRKSVPNGAKTMPDIFEVGERAVHSKSLGQESEGVSGLKWNWRGTRGHFTEGLRSITWKYHCPKRKKNMGE